MNEFQPMASVEPVAVNEKRNLRTVVVAGAACVAAVGATIAGATAGNRAPSDFDDICNGTGTVLNTLTGDWVQDDDCKPETTVETTTTQPETTTSTTTTIPETTTTTTIPETTSTTTSTVPETTSTSTTLPEVTTTTLPGETTTTTVPAETTTTTVVITTAPPTMPPMTITVPEARPTE